MPNATNILNPNNWVSAYSNELYGYAMNKTSKPELAEDLVQETFFAALKSMDNFKGLSSERAWLFTILKFKIADYYRKASTKFVHVPRSVFRNVCLICVCEDELLGCYVHRPNLGIRDRCPPGYPSLVQKCTRCTNETVYQSTIP